METAIADEFLPWLQWSGILTAASAIVTIAAFLFGWGIRFRLVGITGFSAVLAMGVFGLSLGLLGTNEVPGAVPFNTVYDNGGTQLVIKLPPTVTESEVESTLRKAAADLFSLGRMGERSDRLTVRARTITHPVSGISQPLFLGRATRSLTSRDDEVKIEVFAERFSQLPASGSAFSKEQASS
ncbi:protein of function (DUF2518) [Rubidibacter lacunae KORDI 51-2]|uniref:Protein of function (DUF2518) n=1 Tax=Rubidibacter lacunae KORDI 51-2 TaxID=582515 RepID=U5DKL7_9CHRO|nr:Ycf51 family protein [Rubidibacter lacunae]ERN40260.1 protein of function (DUF2518) [Rubidibacter lacunae KORDI 51-2]